MNGPSNLEMLHLEQKLNELADQIAAEGMVVRASQVRAHAAQVASFRHQVNVLRQERDQHRTPPQEPGDVGEFHL